MKTSQEESTLKQRPSAEAGRRSVALSSPAPIQSAIQGAIQSSIQGAIQGAIQSINLPASGVGATQACLELDLKTESKDSERPVGTLVRATRIATAARPRRARCQQLEAEPRR